MARTDLAAMALDTPIVKADENLRNGIGYPFAGANVGAGSRRLMRSQMFDDFELYRGPVATGTGYGYEVINAGGTIANDAADQLEGNGKVLMTSGTGASDHTQISTETAITTMGHGKRMVAGCRLNVDDADEADVAFALHTPGGNLFSGAGITDRITFFMQGANVGNLVGVTTQKDGGGATANNATNAIRDAVLAALGTEIWLAMVVNSDNSVDMLYSTKGNSWLQIVNIPVDQASLPDEAADIMSLGVNVQSGVGNAVNMAVDWLLFSKAIAAPA